MDQCQELEKLYTNAVNRYLCGSPFFNAGVGIVNSPSLARSTLLVTGSITVCANMRPPVKIIKCFPCTILSQ